MQIPNGIGFLLGSAQLILYVIYKNKSTPEDPMEEKGSTHFFEGIIQMNDSSESMKNGSLRRANSLPKPSIARQYNQNITKTISLSPHELGVLNERDTEKGFQESH